MTDEALPEMTETGACDIMDLDMVENLEEADTVETDDDTSAETRTVIGATAADRDNIVKTGANLEERNKETGGIRCDSKSNGETRSEISEFMDEVKGHKEGRNCRMFEKL